MRRLNKRVLRCWTAAWLRLLVHDFGVGEIDLGRRDEFLTVVISCMGENC